MKRRIYALLIALAMVTVLVKPLGAQAKKIEEVEIDTDKYPLSISSVYSADPERISDFDLVYGVLNSSSITEDDYDYYLELQLFDDEAVTAKFHSAMKLKKLDPEKNINYAFKSVLVKTDEETLEEKELTAPSVSIIYPIPDSMFTENDEGELVLRNSDAFEAYRVDSAGKLSPVSATPIMADGTLSAKLTITPGSIYGFILNGVEPVDEDGDGDEDGWGDDEDGWGDDDDDNPNGSSPNVTPTKNPSPTPTPKTNAPTKNPSPTPTPKTNASTKKDNSPKTGDSHSTAGSFAIILIAGGVLVVALKKLKHI